MTLLIIYNVIKNSVSLLILYVCSYLNLSRINFCSRSWNPHIYDIVAINNILSFLYSYRASLCCWIWCLWTIFNSEQTITGVEFHQLQLDIGQLKFSLLMPTAVEPLYLLCTYQWHPPLPQPRVGWGNSGDLTENHVKNPSPGALLDVNTPIYCQESIGDW